MLQSGVAIEMTTDVGGGENIGFLDPGDYLDYEVNVTISGNYNIDFRTAAQFGTGKIELQFIDQEGSTTIITKPSFSSTGGWQDWVTNSSSANLAAGRYTMRIIIEQGPLNMNWMDFKLSTALESLLENESILVNIFPNPSTNIFKVRADFDALQNIKLELYNSTGQLLEQKTFQGINSLQEDITLINYMEGMYFLVLRFEQNTYRIFKLIKIKS